MISLALRLALSKDGETRGRLIATAVGLACATLLLLLILSALHAFNGRDQRTAWMQTGREQRAAQNSKPAISGLYWSDFQDEYKDIPMRTFWTSGSGEQIQPPPGLARWPKAGEYFLSPALAHLVRTEPTALLGERFPGKYAGLIGNEGLDTPQALVAVIGVARSVAARSDGERISSLATTPSNRSSGFKLIFAVGLMGVLFPVFIFVGTACQLGAAQRERRFAALRLVGATPKQVILFASIESLLAACLGAGVGLLLYFLVRPLAAGMSIGGGTFFLNDFKMPSVILLGTLFSVVVAAFVSALIALKRVQIAPLGVVRRATPQSLSLWRLCPLVVGFAALLLFGMIPRSDTSIVGIVLGFLLVNIGIVLVGPWLTLLSGRALSKRATNAAALMAGRRMEAAPTDIFRSVSGVVVGLFVCTAFTGAISGLMRDNEVTPRVPLDTVLVELQHSMKEGDIKPLLQQMQNERGFNGVVPLYRFESGEKDNVSRLWIRRSDLPTLGLGAATGNGEVVPINVFSLMEGANPPHSWPSFALTPQERQTWKYQSLAIRGGRDPLAIERVRSLLSRYVGPGTSTISAQGFTNYSVPEELVETHRLGYAGTVISLFVASCNLVMSLLGSIIQRRQALGLLRLAGMPTRTLTELTFYEGALPLLTVSLLSIVAGLGVASLLLRMYHDHRLGAMPLSYYIIVCLSLTLALAVLTAVIPLMRRLTESEAIRMD